MDSQVLVSRITGKVPRVEIELWTISVVIHQSEPIRHRSIRSLLLSIWCLISRGWILQGNSHESQISVGRSCPH